MESVIAAALTVLPAAVGLWLALDWTVRRPRRRRRRRLAGMAVREHRR